jgi:hypothetical protein
MIASRKLNYESEGFETKRFGDVTFTNTLSRRSFLQAGTMALAATSLTSAGSVFAQTGSAITPSSGPSML